MESTEQEAQQNSLQDSQVQTVKEPIIIDIRDLCELCKSLACCPEHCCNWDQCKCNDCEYCQANAAASEEPSQGIDPAVLIKSTGQEETVKVKRPKTAKKPTIAKPQFLQDDDSDEERKKKQTTEDQEEEESKAPLKSSEQTRAQDGALIINYEVMADEDEEKVVYAGGVKGIRALRLQRDQLNEQIQEDIERNQFQRFEEQKR